MRLYRAPFSTNVERVALALAHKGLEVQSVWIEYGDRSLVERVSGQPLVPVLEFDDGAVMFDSMQIVRVLEERFPQRPLYPADAAGRARTIRFIDWFDDVWKVAPNAIEAEIEREPPDVARIDELAGRMKAALRGLSRCSTGASICWAMPSRPRTARRTRF
jgi:glutathione S-transferase